MQGARPRDLAQAEVARRRGLALGARVGAPTVALFLARPAFGGEDADRLLQVVAVVVEPYRRLGINQEGVRRLVDRCFALPEVAGAVAQAEPGSPGHRLARRLGFERVGGNDENAVLVLDRGILARRDREERRRLPSRH